MGPDRLAALLDRFRIETSLFHTGPMCGVTTFEPRPGRGFLHVLRRGEMEVTHPDDGGGLTKVTLRRPTLLFYPRPLRHAFHNPPVEAQTSPALRWTSQGVAPIRCWVRCLRP
ncbi:hypothetical protein GCM10025789_22080 [Tessaracoccus lubricantis]|uniref:AraC-type transcription regulator ligand-binding domain-containing protein n=1 Tax=Tessaracoccus lubricantis TaxID=545543 RepID=A0ABP9FH93_9ACTN